MRTIPHDTTDDAAKAQMTAFRRLTPEQRLVTYLQACDDMRQLLIDGIRHRHPDYTEEQLREATLRAVLEPALAEEVIAAGKQGRP